MEMFTREIVGWNGAAITTRCCYWRPRTPYEANGGKAPQYIHSDQGSEYDAEDYMR